MGNFRLLEGQNLRGPPATTTTEYLRDGRPSPLDNGPRWKSKGGPTRQVHRSAYHVIYARQRERERKEEHVNGRDVRGPTNHGRGNKERGERREGRKKERRGKKKGGETKKLARMYGAKDWYWWAVEWLQQARETAALKNGRDSLTLARSFHSRAASLECNEEAYVARRKRAGQKNEGKRRGGKSNKTSKTITGNGVQRWSGEARRIAWRSWESREEEANDR